MNLLDIVPAFKRHLGQYQLQVHTDSTLAAYLADAIEALGYRWTRDYVITTTAPNTYEVTPDIAAKDKRTIILMGSIIYKMANLNFGSFKDGDFAYDPQQGRVNPLAMDIAELDKSVPVASARLAQAISAPLRGYASIYNPESYRYILGY